MKRISERGDGNHESVTALLYPNEQWHASLSGETMFFAEDEQVRHAVLPKPGRFGVSST